MSAQLSVFVFMLIAMLSTGMGYGMLMGGYTSEATQGPPDNLDLSLIRSEAEKMCNCGEFTEFHVIEHISQMVAGINYIMRVDVGHRHDIAIKIYAPLPYTNKPPVVENIVHVSKDPLKEPLGPGLFKQRKHRHH